MKFYTPGKVKFKMPRQVRPYKTQETSKNEVYIAPYDAKNVYMIQYHNANQKWTPERAPIISLFNEYFGGSMNAIVFQEMREARGLAYSASAYYASPSRTDDPEYFYTYIITQNDKMGDCIRQFNLLLDSIPERELPSSGTPESDEEHCLFPHHEIWHPHQLLVQPEARSQLRSAPHHLRAASEDHAPRPRGV